jgi:hypothetical protein
MDQFPASSSPSTMSPTKPLLERLHEINTNLEHNDPMQDVNNTLQTFEQVLGEFQTQTKTSRQMQIYHTSCVYSSVNQRAQQWQQYLDRNPDLAKTYTREAWEAERDAFGIVGDAVHSASQKCYTIYTVSLQNIVFTHSWSMTGGGGANTPEERARFYRGDKMWHEFVIMLNQQKV